MPDKLKIHHMMVCDDIRFEMGGKLTFVGAYGRAISVRKFPLQLRLAFRIELSLPENGNANFKVWIKSPKNEEIAGAELAVIIEEVTNRDILPLRPIPFQAMGPGRYSLHLRAFGITRRAGFFHVEQASKEMPFA